MRISPLNRILLLCTCLLAAYQVVAGIDGLESIPTIAYTVGFGILLVACLLIVILGYDVLDSPVVVIVSTIIPLSLSLGVVWEHAEGLRIPYLVFTILGLLAIIICASSASPGGLQQLSWPSCMGSPEWCFLLPTILAAQGAMNPGLRWWVWVEH
jgi:hypothetical protein